MDSGKDTTYIPLRPRALLRAGAVPALAVLAFIGWNAGKQALSQPGLKLLCAAAYGLCALFLAGGAAFFFRKRRKLFLAVLVPLSLGTALAVALWAQTEPIAEYARMLQTALDLRAGQWDALRSNEYYHAWAYQGGFVLFQTLVFCVLPPSILSLLIVNALTMAGIKVTIYVLLGRCCSSETAIFLTVLYLLNPSPYLLASVLTNQHFSLLLMLLGLCLLGRGAWRGAAAGGICFALACAVRPDAWLVYPALAVLALLAWLCGAKPREKSPKQPFFRTAHGGMVLSVTVGLAAGWLLSGLVVVTGLNPGGLRNHDPLWKLAFGLNIETEGRFSAEMAETLMAAPDQTERARMEREIIRSNLSRGPGAMITFLRDKLTRSWSELEQVSWAFAGQDARPVPLLDVPLRSVLPVLQLAERLLILCLAALGCAGFARSLHRGADAGTALCALMIIGFFIVHAVIEFQPRYRYFICPFVTFAAAGGAEWLRQSVQNKPVKRRK